MKKTLWIIGGGSEAVKGIEVAKAMGLYVVVTDGNTNAPGFEFADDSIVIDIFDINKQIYQAKGYNRKIDGVICMAVDAAKTVAYMAQELELQSISVETAEYVSNKLLMKQRFEKDKVPIAWFSPVLNITHLKKLVASEGFPLVLKPTDSRGSRGVLLLDKNVDLDWAYKYSLSFSSSETLIIERFLSGQQVSSESLVINGKAYTVGLADRNYEFLERFSPYIIENGGELPATLSTEIGRLTEIIIQKAVTSLGIENGTAKGDIVVNNGTPYIIEMAARLSGGHFSTYSIPLSTGVEYVKYVIKIALGESFDIEEIKPKYHKKIKVRYDFPTKPTCHPERGESSLTIIL